MSLSFGESLRRLRMEKGLSQQRLSEILFVDRSTIVRWETGSRTPDVLLLTRIAEALDVDVRLLLDAEASGEESGEDDDAAENTENNGNTGNAALGA